eukprot:351311-Chlamydomonas_euryale.AAC.1
MRTALVCTASGSQPGSGVSVAGSHARMRQSSPPVYSTPLPANAMQCSLPPPAASPTCATGARSSAHHARSTPSALALYSRPLWRRSPTTRPLCAPSTAASSDSAPVPRSIDHARSEPSAPPV